MSTLGELHTHAIHGAIGIPAPPPPRTGTLGLSEEDTREMAGRTPHADAIAVGSLNSRNYNAPLAIHRADVARWDAEDEAARNAVPDTLTVKLLTADVKHYAECCATSEYPETQRVIDAFRAALDEAGIA